MNDTGYYSTTEYPYLNLTSTEDTYWDDFNSTSFTSSRDTSWYQGGLLLTYSLQVGVITLGIISNILNIVVFLKAGLNDSVTVSFFGLSTSDLIHLMLFLIVRLLTIFQYEFGVHSSIVRLQDLAGFLSWLSVYFVDVSMFITVYATFQKCCCVVFPLKFNSVFTARRSAFVIALLYAATLLIFFPVFYHILDKWFFDPATRDKPLNWVIVITDTKPTVWRWMHRITFTITSQVIVIASLVIITAKLKQSVRFRQSTRSEDYSGGGGEGEGGGGGGGGAGGQKDKSNEGIKMGAKELRAIQAVRLIAVIFVVTTLPASLNSLMTVVFPSINEPQYKDLVATILAVVYFGGTTNASVNIFVYLKYNRRYRSTFKGIFCGWKKK